MLLNILLVILVIDCIALTGVILLQRSEGGALGMGSGPSGIFTARGAGDLLTRTTSILTIIFFSLSLIITLLAGHNRAGTSLTEHLKVNPLQLNELSRSGAPATSTPGAPPLPNAAKPQPQAQRAPTPAPETGIALPGLPQSVGAPRTAGGPVPPPPATSAPAAPRQ